MRNSVAIEKAVNSVFTELPEHCALYPYFEARAKTVNHHNLMAGAQQLFQQKRKSDFDARVREFRIRGESLRSFPTPSGVIPWDQVAQVANNEVFTNAELDSDPLPIGQADEASNASAQPTEASHYPFDEPPLDIAAYGHIEIEPEYDQSMADHPLGEEGQPVVYDWSKATTGQITKIGFFPYRFKKGETKAHMIRIGTKDHWGVDLERVVREFGLKEGERIALVSIGKQPVVLKKRVRQEDGTFKTVDSSAMRNTWACKRI